MSQDCAQSELHMHAIIFFHLPITYIYIFNSLSINAWYQCMIMTIYVYSNCRSLFLSLKKINLSCIMSIRKSLGLPRHKPLVQRQMCFITSPRQRHCRSCVLRRAQHYCNQSNASKVFLFQSQKSLYSCVIYFFIRSLK